MDTLQPVLVRFGPDDTAALDAAVGILNAEIAHEAPWEHPVTRPQLDGTYRHGWDGEPFVPFLAHVDGTPIGLAAYSVSAYSNPHLAWVEVTVHPAHRRRGHGTALLDAMRREAAARGCTTVAIGSWELDGSAAFAAAHGFEPKSVEVNRRQPLSEVDWVEVERLRRVAVQAAAEYEVVRWPRRTPETGLAALAELTAAINDAPTDDLDLEDEAFPPERIRAYEDAQLARGGGFHRLVARHRASGELAGHTVVKVEADRPHLAEQHDTSVVRAHRGHRLGLLLKTEMLGWLREVEPALASIDTWNAESNDHMIEVNEALGYRIVHRAVIYQREV